MLRPWMRPTATETEQDPASSEPTMYRCSVCHWRSGARSAAVDHARAKHSRDYTACHVVTLLCRKCGRDLPTAEAWRIHRATVHRGWARASEREWPIELSWPTRDRALRLV